MPFNQVHNNGWDVEALRRWENTTKQIHN
jgi:hypothetical protein